jgi:hypothetical protein
MNDGIVYAWMIFIVEKARKKLFFKEIFWCREKCIKQGSTENCRYTYICKKNLSKIVDYKKQEVPH